ncbi:MAG: Xaa-Pro peptidase family protein [Methanoregulaceae archaeon]|nr:Xaa-Pro peptidase family protein [Methanoregulaceae archaeon]
MDALDKALEKNGADAFVMIGSSDNADMRYLTHFITTDPVVYIKKKGEEGVIVVSQMEYERAGREAIVPVITRAEAGLIRILDEEPDRWRAMARMIAEYVKGGVLVPLMFPYGLGIGISEYSRIIVDNGTIGMMRAKKRRDEIVSIQHVQRATEAAMELAIDLIRSSKPKKGILFRGRDPLTSEAVQLVIRELLQKKGCNAWDTIVSCGKDTALPHVRGSGPLQECEPIVIDISPRDEASGYYSDMTRTVSKGIPESEIREMYIAVRDAQDLAAACIKPGIPGSTVHQAVVDLFKERGYTTGTEGFTHNLGHGVGLEVHELPTLGPGGEKLVRGNVITNEPGLYYNRFGGVRIENIGVVSRTGHRCLTQFPRELVI